MARQQPEQREPPVAWVRVRYTKVGPARFMSARDIGRVMERALKRAQVPVAYSSGFSPHQRVSYAFPAPTGAASLAEYALVALAQPMAADDLATALNRALPTGMEVFAGLTDKRPLPPQLEASSWELAWPGIVLPPQLDEVVGAFIAEEAVVVGRRAKSGVKQQDVRSAVVSMTVAKTLNMTLRQSEPLIRPGDVVAGLATWCQEVSQWGTAGVFRSGQGRLLADGQVQNLN